MTSIRSLYFNSACSVFFGVVLKKKRGKKFLPFILNKVGLKKRLWGNGIRVLLADDHEVMRESLAKILMENQGFAVVGEAQTGREAVRLAEELEPDVVIMDVEMPEMNGFQATSIITGRRPEMIVIGLSMHEDAMTRQLMEAAGARGFLSKTASIDQLCDSIRRHLPSEQLLSKDL